MLRPCALSMFMLGLLLRGSISIAQADELYAFKRRLIQGDERALWEIAPYFDSSRVVVEYLGHHRLEVELSFIAQRIVLENTVFGPEAFPTKNATTARQFTEFLDRNASHLEYSELAGAFMVVPLEEQRITFAVRSITPLRKSEVDARSAELVGHYLFDSTEVKHLIDKHDPKALLAIASSLYRARCRHNSYFFDVTEVLDLLRHLTGEELGFDHGDGRIVWDVGDVCPTAMEWSLLVYYAQHFAEYQWDEHLEIFQNATTQKQVITEVELLFQLLSSKNDSIALDAFLRLSEADTAQVSATARDHQKAGIKHSRILPIFTYKFLLQLVQLTAYCRAEGIDHLGRPELMPVIDRLKQGPDFPERRSLEDSLIVSLRLDDITAFEYWVLVHQTSWHLTYSAGRILNIFYSNHWNEIVHDDAHLRTYLKKSRLFDRLGIIGVCNNYLNKFEGSSPDVLRRLDALVSSDPDIVHQRDRILAAGGKMKKAEQDRSKFSEANYDGEVPDLEQRLATLLSRTTDLDKAQDTLVKVFSKITYEQIGFAMRSIEDYTFQQVWEKYSFMQRDWGFFMLKNFNEPATRELFLQLYDSLSQYDLYAWQLDRAGINYKQDDGALDHDKIYDLLKYGVVVAFVGGGGGYQDNEVYALVKLLEITHGTTLGFPRKFCNSKGLYGCDSKQRVTAWMDYLETHHLLRQEHNGPPSFN